MNKYDLNSYLEFAKLPEGMSALESVAICGAICMARNVTLQRFAYKIEHLYFFKLFVLAKYDDKSYHI